MAAKPTLKQLKYLCAVANTRHFGNAAKACHVTQSTLSAGIQELETTLGINLVERSNKTVLLTATGNLVVERAQTILTEVEELVEEAASTLEPFNRAVRLGVIPTIAPFLLPSALTALRKDYPDFQLLIREDLSENLINLLNQGDLDLLLMALPYPMSNVTVHHLFQDPFCAAYPAGHPLSKIKKLHTRDLKGHDILLLENGHCLRDQALEACKLLDQQISLSFEATSLHTLVPMVANGIGITLLPQMAIDTGILSGLDNVETRAFSKADVSRSIDFVWRAKSPRAEEYRMLTRYFKKTGKS
ncbi:MAG: hydrogen peroxide-inducible genes activator [Porticoccaceae bacterium]|nr:hydrogen peroxide-inducible genes activator [Porticoccaceae bacterium]